MKAYLITFGIIVVLAIIAYLKNNLTYRYRIRLLDISMVDYDILTDALSYEKMFINVFNYWTFSQVLKKLEGLKGE